MFTLASQVFGFGQLMTQLEAIGFFSFVLPFLLIFAFSYALLAMVPVFSDRKGAAAIVAAALGFLSIQLPFVPEFFSVIFPKFGMGLAILIVALILSSIFLQTNEKGASTTYTWVFFGLGFIIFLVIALSSLSDYTSGLTGFWDRYGALMIVLVLVIAAIVAIFVAQKKDKTS